MKIWFRTFSGVCLSQMMNAAGDRPSPTHSQRRLGWAAGGRTRHHVLFTVINTATFMLWLFWRVFLLYFTHFTRELAGNAPHNVQSNICRHLHHLFVYKLVPERKVGLGEGVGRRNLRSNSRFMPLVCLHSGFTWVSFRAGGCVNPAGFTVKYGKWKCCCLAVYCEQISPNHSVAAS